jgi:cytochrome b6-f complex iron-sulfur subunit
MSTLPITHRRVTRRELLNYVWMASMALLLAKAGSAAFVFALPRFSLAQADLPVDVLPAVDGEPLLLDVDVSPAIAVNLHDNHSSTAPSGLYRIYVTHTTEGVRAFMNRCTHMGCVFPWIEDAGIFACPCHGSQFRRDGDWIAGPAPRALDRFPIIAKDAQNNEIARSQEDGLLVLPANASRITIDHSTLLLGKRHA